MGGRSRAGGVSPASWGKDAESDAPEEPIATIQFAGNHWQATVMVVQSVSKVGGKVSRGPPSGLAVWMEDGGSRGRLGVCPGRRSSRVPVHDRPTDLPC